MSRKTILVIDDQKDFAELVQRALEDAGFDVILAPDGTTGLRIARKCQPSLILLDLTMPDIDGLEVCRQLRAEPRHARLPILIMSARAGVAERVMGLEIGADDYMIKPFVPSELVARIRAVLRRSDNRPIARAEIRAGDLVIDVHGHRVTVQSKEVTLTAAEFRIIEFIATHAGRAFSRDEIIESALQSDLDVTERTVDTHISGIRKAIGPAAGHIETVRGVGYRFNAVGKS